MASKITLQWRTKLPQQIEHLPFPGLSTAFDEADTVLQARSEAEVVEIAVALWQKLLQQHPKPLAASIIPRLIYALHSNTLENASSEVTLNEHLAAAIIVELSRACGVCAKKMNQASWIEAATAVANVRTLSDWLYILDAKDSVITGGEKPLKQDQGVGATVKTKGEASTKAWRKKLKPHKQKVLAYYNDHKSEFNSLSEAAEIIESENLVPYTSKTIYKWLKKHVK